MKSKGQVGEETHLMHDNKTGDKLDDEIESQPPIWRREIHVPQIPRWISFAKCMLLPALFSACMWYIVASPQRVVRLVPVPDALLPKNITHVKDLAPDSLYDSFLLGEIAANLQDASPEDVPELLGKASEILRLDGNLTVHDVTEGVIQSIQLKDQKRERLKKLKGAFSFVGMLSIIATIGIFVTLAPVAMLLWEVLRLDVLWKLLVVTFSCLKTIIQPLIDPVLYTIPLVIFVTSFHYPEGGARAQLAILAAGFALLTFFVRTMKNMHSAEYVLELIFIWCWSFLTPMALSTGSKFLGFFAVGSIFGALGFLVLPMPFGWAAGFRNEISTDRCMVVSLIIIGVSLGAKAGVYHVPDDIMQTFETGAAVFGMLSFGLAGLIKSMKLSSFNSTYPLSFVYPLAWLVLAYLGSIYSYPSLTNTSITFIGLWISQFYWRLCGVSSVSVFIASCVLYWVTLWLKTHTEFLASLFKV